MLKILKRLFSNISPQKRWYWGALIPLSIVEATSETLGAGAIFSLIKIIEDPGWISNIPIISGVYTLFSVRESKTVILSFTLFITLFYILKNLLLIMSTYLRSRLTNKTIEELSSRLFRGYLAAPFSFHLQRNSSTLIDRTNRSIHIAVHLGLESAVACISEILVVCGIITVLVLVSPFATIISVVVLVCLLGILLFASQRLFFKIGSVEQHFREKSLQTLQQALEGIKEVKVMAREQYWYNIFSSHQKVLSKQRRLHETLNAAPRFLIEAVFITIPLIIVFLTINRPGTGAGMLPLLGLFAYAGFRVIPSFNRITMHVNNMKYGSVDANMVCEDFKNLCHGDDPHISPPATQITMDFTETLQLEHVSYSYEGTGVNVLDDIALSIKRGESVGIVGLTGAGKSTIIDLILGLLSPSQGRIIVDGRDIQDSVALWRQKIGYVPQDIYLTDDSLRRNIAFGIIDKEIDEESIRTALRLAQLKDFVSSLPNGLDTPVGERGVKLSGGEKQRVAIARALYHAPELLIFDEATSALDRKTEQELSRAIDGLHGRKTMIIVAHRMTTIKSCDRIVFLRNGRIEAYGPMEELLRENTEFQKLS